MAKQIHARVRGEISAGLSVFAEYCYAVHSIAYDALPGYVLVFGVRDDGDGTFWSWGETTMLADELGLPTVPLLYRGAFPNVTSFEAQTKALAAQASVFGGPREGVVARLAGAIPGEAFGRSVAKWVRRDHVQTDDHWLHQAVVPQRLGAAPAEDVSARGEGGAV